MTVRAAPDAVVVLGTGDDDVVRLRFGGADDDLRARALCDGAAVVASAALGKPTVDDATGR